MRIFLIVWLGHLVSMFGTSLTRFALGVWIYEQTGSTTRFALTLLVTALPEVLLLPIGGSLADRMERRRIMLLSAAASALCVLVLVGLLYWGLATLPAIYLVMGLCSAFIALPVPALTASIPLMVPREQLARANGMMEMASACAQILAPAVAGLMLGKVGLHGLVLMDFLSFLFVVLTLLPLRFVQPAPTPRPTAGGNVLVQDIRMGLAYILARPGLAGLLLILALINFNVGMIQTLITPTVMGFASSVELGRVMSVGGVGVLVGSVAMSVWGGPRRRVYGILGFTFLQGLVLAVSGVRQSLPLITTGAFVFLLLFPVVEGSSQVLWMSKVDPEVQGRVFAVRRALAWSFLPFSYGLAGPLADHVFGPLLLPGGPLASSVGLLFGVGKGRGEALLLSLVGVLTSLIAVGGFLHPRVRHLQDELPDTLPHAPPVPPRAHPDAAS